MRTTSCSHEDRLEGASQDVLATGAAQQMDLGAGQVDGGGYQAQTLDSLDLEPDLGDFGPTDQHIVQGGGEVVGIQPQRKGEAGLGIKIDHQDRASPARLGRPRGTARWSSWPHHPFGWPLPRLSTTASSL